MQKENSRAFFLRASLPFLKTGKLPVEQLSENSALIRDRAALDALLDTACAGMAQQDAEELCWVRSLWSAEWFSANRVLAVWLIERSGSVRHQAAIEEAPGKVWVHILRERPPLGTMDQAGWLILAPLTLPQEGRIAVELDINWKEA